MAEPRLVDTVTFRHFGGIRRLEVLEARLRRYPGPRSTGAILGELLAHSRDEDAADCRAILESGILGTPLEVGSDDFLEVFRVRKALSFDQEKNSLLHLGEAESIVAADRLNGAFVTDDTEAFAFAEVRLGGNRVLDTVDLLREAVKYEEIASSDAKLIVEAIRNSGRHLRSVHPRTVTAEFFEPL